MKILCLSDLHLRPSVISAVLEKHSESPFLQEIKASDGLADNSAQTIKCTFSGRMTITTLGNINFYDGANFSHINSDQEV